MSFPRLNETILNLYRGCRNIPAHDFKEWAMETVRSAVDFDSGFWATAGEIVSQEFSSVYLFRQPPAMLENYERTVGLTNDLLAQAVVANPGQTMVMERVIPRDEFVAHPAYLQHCRHFGIEHALGTCHVSPVTLIPSGICFYRAHPDKPFSEADRRAKELLIPHMIEAMRINLFTSLQVGEVRRGEALAFCDARGVLYETTAEFPVLLATVWPDWRGPRLDLPGATLDGADATRWSADGIKFEAEPCRDLFLVRAARVNALDCLSPRQLVVAELLVRGKRYKEIGRMLGISPSTVTNHVNQIHAKLGIGKREELIRLFSPER